MPPAKVSLNLLRQAEASSLSWGDVDWTNTNEGSNGILHIKREKTSERFPVPIYEHLRPLLERLYKSYPTPPPPETKVFKILDARKALKAACERLNYHHFTQRNIRAFLIRRLWRSGVDKKLIAKWQGHQDGGKLLIDTYTEVFGSDDADYMKSELAKIK